MDIVFILPRFYSVRILINVQRLHECEVYITLVITPG